MEIMNNAKVEAGTSNNVEIVRTVKNARLAALEEKYLKNREKNRVKQEIAKEKRAEDLQKDTAFASIVTSRGYVGFMLDSMDGSVSQEPVVAPHTGMSAPTATLSGVFNALKAASHTGKKHVVLYVNGYEAQRVAGFMKKILAGSQELFTEAEAGVIFSERNQNRYGEPYKQASEKVWLALSKFHANGVAVRIMSHSSIFGYALKKPANIPVTLAGTTVTFRNNVATVAHKGRNVRLVGASESFKLNGKFVLEESYGQIVVPRNIEEGSEQEFAHDLLRIVNLAIGEASDEARLKKALGDSFDDLDVGDEEDVVA